MNTSSYIASEFKSFTVFYSFKDSLSKCFMFIFENLGNYALISHFANCICVQLFNNFIHREIHNYGNISRLQYQTLFKFCCTNVNSDAQQGSLGKTQALAVVLHMVHRCVVSSTVSPSSLCPSQNTF